MATWDFGERWQLTVAPRVFTYVGNLAENPDIATYRGFVDLVASFGRRDGWQLAALGHVGRGGHYGSIQLDLTYPLDQITFGWTNCFAQVQWFSGYAENLLDYRQHSDRVLVGIAIVR
jgi:outer membrane phospholipase A